MSSNRPLVDLAIGALLALIVLLVTPGIAIAAIVALIVLLAIGGRAVLRRRALGSSTGRVDAARARRPAR